MTSQIIPHPYAYNAHGPGRVQFSMLCWRGWCDNSYRDAEVGAMVQMVTGAAPPSVPALPARQCTSDACECECHDDERGETEGQQS